MCWMGCRAVIPFNILRPRAGCVFRNLSPHQSCEGKRLFLRLLGDAFPLLRCRSSAVVSLLLLGSCYVSPAIAAVRVIKNTSCCPLALLLHVTCLPSCHLSGEREHSSACAIAGLINCPNLISRRKQRAGWLLRSAPGWYICSDWCVGVYLGNIE